MTTTTSTRTFSGLINGDLTFSDIISNEIDIFNGTSGVAGFNTHAGNPVAITSGLDLGMAWKSISMETFSDGAGASQTVTLTYSVSASGTQFITSIDSSYTVDLLAGDGNVIAIETITDAYGDILATQTFTSGVAAPPPVQLSMGVQNANVTLTITETANSFGSDISFSVLDQIFGQTDGSKLAALGDYVWYDANSNGIQDNTETGVAGVTVDLLNGNGSVLIGVTTTNAAGAYHFNGLLPGTYEVKFINPIGTTFTTAGSGPDRAADSNADQVTGITGPITLTAGQTDNTIDAGLVLPVQQLPAALGDFVWYDANGNGLQDGTETGVAGVTVDLLNANGTSVLGVTTTNAAGKYSFTNLAPGTYEVQFIQPVGMTFTTAGVGGNPGVDSNASTVTGITAPVTLTAGQTDLTIDAGLILPAQQLPASLGDKVWCDANGNGIQDANESGVAGVTVDLLNANGTSVLAVTTTNAAGAYHFTNLAAGTYEVKFIAPAGDKFTLQTKGNNAAADSNPNAGTGVTGPITLTAGQTDNTIDAGLVPDASISVDKIAAKAVVSACGQVTYQFNVTNTGTAALTHIVIKDNIGTAANPNYIVPTAVKVNGFISGDANHNNVLDGGETWQYQVTTTPSESKAGNCGTVSHTCSGGNLHAGNTAWFNCSFTPTNTKDGTCYVFRDVECRVSGSGTGAGGYNQKCPDAEVRFSASCTQATTNYDANRDCWVTTLPANCNPGKVFMTGSPVTVPAGCDFSNATCDWTIGDSGNNCGASSVNWTAACKGYTSFNQNGCDGRTDYNQIGVKVCDNRADYGNGGSTNLGYGYSDGGYGASGGGWGWSANGWLGSSKDGSGTPENQYTSSGCGSYSGSGGGCGTGATAPCAQIQVGADGVADTVTVSASTACATVSHTCSGGYLTEGHTGWFNCNFTPTNTKDGTCYVFRDVECKVTPKGVGASSYNVSCGDAEIRFSSSCSKPTTVYDSGRDCWVTTLPANSTPGKVFMTGCPVTVPAGQDFTNATCEWSIGDSGNNCGAGSINWNASCAGYDSFNRNGINGCADYNKIGVKVCDNSGAYGNGGSTSGGYGYHDGGYTSGAWGWNNSGWCGSSTDSCGTPENAYVSGNCDDTSRSFGSYGWGASGGGATGNGCGTGGSGGCGQTVVPSGCDPCAVIPATCCGPVTVSASDTTEVIVIDATNKISIDGSVPLGSLTALYGKAQTLEFTYNASDVVSTKTIGIGAFTGHNTDNLAFIEISNNANPFAANAQIYFQGTVGNGQKLYADASINSLTNTENTGSAAFMSTVAGQGIYAFIFDSQAAFKAGAAAMQTDTYNTSGSQAMYLNDQIGSLKLVGYVGSTGGHLAS